MHTRTIALLLLAAIGVAIVVFVLLWAGVWIVTPVPVGRVWTDVLH